MEISFEIGAFWTLFQISALWTLVGFFKIFSAPVRKFWFSKCLIFSMIA